jgi:hypothetical protein
MYFTASSPQEFFLALLILLALAVLVLIALGYGVRGLWLLRSTGGKAGLRMSLMALGIAAAVEAATVVFIVPARPLLWMPLPSIGVAATALVLGILRRRRVAGIVQLAAAIATVALTFGGGQALQRWDHRHECQVIAEDFERSASNDLAAARQAEVCVEHVRRGQRCSNCGHSSLESLTWDAEQFRQAARQGLSKARYWRRTADD